MTATFAASSTTIDGLFNHWRKSSWWGSAGSHAISIRQRPVSFRFFFSFRVLLCMSWDPDRWRITNVFDSCHDVKQNTWPSICFPQAVPLGKRSAGVRDYCYYSTHSSALAQCPTTINPHERPIGRSDIFHGHPPVGHPDETKRQSTLPWASSRAAKE